MRRWSLVLSITVATTAGVVLDAGAQSSVSDDFNDGSLDECKWRTFFVGPPGSVAETDQQLRAALGPSAGSAFQAGVRSTWYVNDIYDIQVDYHLLYWPPWNGIRVGLGVDADGLVERVRFNNTYSDFPGYGQDVYPTDFGDGVAGIKASTAGRSRRTAPAELGGWAVHVTGARAPPPPAIHAASGTGWPP